MKPLTKPRREELPPGADLCAYCTGKCCRYITIAIDRPKTWESFDTLRWYLTHHDINVFVEKGEWFVMVLRDCRHLQSDNRCGVYEDRPKVCRDHSTDNCEYEDDYDYELIFENDQQIREYAEALLGPSVVPPMPLTLSIP